MFDFNNLLSISIKDLEYLICCALISSHKLYVIPINMKIITQSISEFIATYYFSASLRIDFKQLMKIARSMDANEFYVTFRLPSNQIQYFCQFEEPVDFVRKYGCFVDNVPQKLGKKAKENKNKWICKINS